LTLSIKGINLK